MSRDAFEQALLVISTGWVTQNRRFPVRLDRILYEAWNTSRLDRCREKLAQGLTAPAVKLTGLKLKTRTWYSVSDGMHRCAARAEAGKVYINAEVGGYHVCDPSAFVIWRGVVWRQKGDVREAVWEPSPECLEELRRLGVSAVE